eukprot:4882994-Pyramimonas_sp.AAC.2
MGPSSNGPIPINDCRPETRASEGVLRGSRGDLERVERGSRGGLQQAHLVELVAQALAHEAMGAAKRSVFLKPMDCTP